MDNKNIAYRILESIPFVGKALALVWELTAMGIAQHGLFLGLLKGGSIGIILAVVMVVVGEGFYAAYGLGRTWLDYAYLNEARSAIITGITTHGIAKTAKDDDDEYRGKGGISK